jgi:hypothetical protein
VGVVSCECIVSDYGDEILICGLDGEWRTLEEQVDGYLPAMKV